MTKEYTSFDHLLDDVLAKYRSGASPDIQSLCDAHPQYEADIRELLPSILLMEDVKTPRATDGTQSDAGPDHVAGYRIVREIGRGGMGVVYEAEHLTLGRRAALKVLSNRLAGSSEAVERFRREGRAIAKLHHTNIVPLFEVGDDDGKLYLAMQLISGRSLSRVIKELRDNVDGSGRGSDAVLTNLLRPASTDSNDTSALRVQSSSVDSSASRLQLSDGSRSPRRRYFRSVARIGLQVADALHYAHSRGIIHRDVKPSNLLLDKNGVVWLTDFGLAKTEDDDLTQTGDFVGTLRYMSPERFKGDYDARSDIYSLGLTLYELLARRPAFESSDHVSLIRMISTEEPTRLRQINSNVPRDLETIVLKAIDRDPRSRYRTASALADDLECYLHDQPIKARRHSIPERFIRWSRRNRSLSAAIASIAIMALVTIVVLGFSLRTARLATIEARRSASQALLTQADSAFDDRRFQSSAVLANASLDFTESEAATAKLQSARASAPAKLSWVSPTLRDVSAMAKSAEGARLASASATEDTIWIWDSDTLQVINRLNGHDETVTSLAFDPTGKRLLSGSKDQTVRMWDVHSGQGIWNHSISSTCSSVAIDRSGKLAAAGGVFRGTVWVWDCETGKQRHRFLGEGDPVRVMAFGSSNQLAAGFENGEVRVWDLATEQVRTLRGIGQVNALVFADDGRLVVGTDKELSVWDLADSEPKKLWSDGANLPVVTALTINRHEKSIVAGFGNGDIRVWDLRALRELSDERLSLDNSVIALELDSKGKNLVVATANQGRGSTDRSIRTINRRTGRETAWTRGHADSVRQLAFDATGRRLATLADDNTARVWNVVDGRMMTRIATNRSRIRCIAISPDGNIVASATDGKRLRLHHVESGDELISIDLTRDNVNGIAFHPDGDQIITSASNVIQYWRYSNTALDSDDAVRLEPTGKPKRLEKEDATIQPKTLCYNQDGTRIACATSTKDVFVWSAHDGSLLAEIQLDDTRPASDLQFSADGTRLAVRIDDSYHCHVFDLTEAESPRKQVTVYQNTLTNMSLSPDGSFLITGGADPTVNIWSADTGSLLSQLEGHRGAVNSLLFGPNNQTLASSSSAEVRMWQFRGTGTETIHGAEFAGKNGKWDDVHSMLFAFGFGPDENQMFIKGMWGGYQALLLNRQTGQQRAFKGGYGGYIDPMGRWLALCTKSGKLELIALDSQQRIELPHDGRAMRSLSVNVDGSRLAGSAGGDVVIWDTQSHQRLCIFPAHVDGTRNYVLFHPTDPNLLATGGMEGMLYLWDVSSESPRRLRQYDGHNGQVGRIAFSRDGNYLISGAYTESPHVLLWERESGRLVRRFVGHQDRVADVDMSPDGRWIASASRDFTVRLWDTAEGTEVRRFQEHTEDVFCVQFSEDGRQLISASADGTIRFRDLRAEGDLSRASRAELANETGLQIVGERITPIPRSVDWHIEPANP